MADQTIWRHPIAVVGAIVIVIFFLISSWLNKVDYSKEQIQIHWNDVIANCNKRSELALEYISLIKKYAPEHSNTNKKLITLYETSKKYPQTSTELLADDSKLNEYIFFQRAIIFETRKAYHLLENYKEFKDSPLNKTIAQKTAMLENELKYISYNLNLEIDVFNSKINKNPQKWINQLFLHNKNIQKVDFFKFS